MVESIYWSWLLRIKHKIIKPITLDRTITTTILLIKASKGLMSRFSHFTFEGSSGSKSICSYTPWNICFSGQTNFLHSRNFVKSVYRSFIFSLSSNLSKVTKAPRFGTSSIELIPSLKNFSFFSLSFSLSYFFLFFSTFFSLPVPYLTLASSSM